MVKLLKEYDTAAAESFCCQEAHPAPEVGPGLQPDTKFYTFGNWFCGRLCPFSQLL